MARQARHELWLRVAVWHEETVASNRVKYKARVHSAFDARSEGLVAKAASARRQTGLRQMRHIVARMLRGDAVRCVGVWRGLVQDGSRRAELLALRADFEAVSILLFVWLNSSL